MQLETKNDKYNQKEREHPYAELEIEGAEALKCRRNQIRLEELFPVQVNL